MNILVITDLYPIRKDEKYTPKTIYNFVQGWKNLGHNVKVIKPNFVFNSFLRKKPFYKSGIYGDVENINYFFPFLFDIKKRVKTDLQGYDVVIAHMPSGLIFANRLGLNFIAGVHVSDLEVLTKPIYSVYFKNELKKAYKNSTKIACRSEIIRKKFLKLFPQYENKTFVAYSGIDFEPIKREWQKKEKYRIITCANLKKRKNIDKVIEVCAKLSNVELVIAGDGKEFKKLKKISKNLPNIKFLGHLPNEKVIEEMKKSDIFILPSVNETFGMVYLEAMAAGCLTVGLENDGIDGIIKNKENGYLCNLNNINKTLLNIINSDNQNQILENSYTTVKNYTSENACLNYLQEGCGKIQGAFGGMDVWRERQFGS